MKIVHTYINNMYIDSKEPDRETFADRWGLLSQAKLGHEVTLICGSNKKQRTKYFWKGVKIIELPRLLEVTSSTTLVKGFITELSKIKADVFHCHHYCFLFPEITVLVGKIRRIPTFITIHTTFHELSGFQRVMEKTYLLFMQPFLPLFKKVFFISNYIKDSIQFKLIKSKKKSLLRNKINAPKLFKTKRQENTILYIGRIRKVKGVDILIKSLCYVKKEIPNINLNIIVKKQERYYQELTRFINKNNLQENVTFHDPEYTSNKWKHFYQNTIMVVPSRGEAFGNVVIEGMLCDIPVIHSDKGALPEAAGGKGIMFNIKEPKDLADKIITLLKNKNLREKTAKEAKEYAKSFTQDLIGKKTIEEYQEAL